LINLPSEHPPDVPPAYNQLVPAWVLVDNVYALKRTEYKHRARNRATRENIETAVLRPAVIDRMRAALRRLENVQEHKPVYIDRDITGLGKNFMLEQDRVAAVESY